MSDVQSITREKLAAMHITACKDAKLSSVDEEICNALRDRRHDRAKALHEVAYGVQTPAE